MFWNISVRLPKSGSGCLVGEPIVQNLDWVQSMIVRYLGEPNDRSKPRLLPKRGWAVPQICRSPVTASIDPAHTALANTTTIFLPEDNLADFPFDLLLLSSPYRFYLSIAARMGVFEVHPAEVARDGTSNARATAGAGVGGALRMNGVALGSYCCWGSFHLAGMSAI